MDLAETINQRYGRDGYRPIILIDDHQSHEELTELYRAADICVVSSLHDGMNLVAKEFVAAQDPADPGVLILSPLAGAARELTGAIQANPYDAKGLGHAIQAALAMPLAERRERHASMLEIVRSKDVRAWHERFIAALKHSTAPSVEHWEHHAFQKTAPLR